MGRPAFTLPPYIDPVQGTQAQADAAQHNAMVAIGDRSYSDWLAMRKAELNRPDDPDAD